VAKWVAAWKTGGVVTTKEATVSKEREKEILDKGYDAVRLMAKEMVQNGASLADILFHANQVWHEFKASAASVGYAQAMIKTSTYIEGYDHEQTKKLILCDPRYYIQNSNHASYIADKQRMAELKEGILKQMPTGPLKN
jgi:hypothetical protein